MPGCGSWRPGPNWASPWASSIPRAKKASARLQKERLSRNQSFSRPGFTGQLLVLDQIGLSASWEIDFWGKFRRAVESADASLMAAVADYDNALVSLTGDVANSYISLRTLEKRLAHCPPECGGPEEELCRLPRRAGRAAPPPCGTWSRPRRCWTAPRPASPPWKHRRGRPRTPSASSWACRPVT